MSKQQFSTRPPRFKTVARDSFSLSMALRSGVRVEVGVHHRLRAECINFGGLTFH